MNDCNRTLLCFLALATPALNLGPNLRKLSARERAPQVYLVVLCCQLFDNLMGGGIAGIGPDRIGISCEPNGLKTGFDRLSRDFAGLTTAAFNKRSKMS